MTSIKFLKELFDFHGHRVFIKTKDRSITFFDFAQSLDYRESNWIAESDPILFLQNLFSTLFNKQIPILANLYWTEAQLQATRKQAGIVRVDVPAIGIFTSGTTSEPKLAIIPLESFVRSSRSANENIPFDEGDEWLLNLPLFHVGGLGIVFRALLSGGAIYLTNKRFEELVLNEHSITHVSMVPTQLYRFLSAPVSPIQRIKAILVGGGSVSESLISKAYDRNLPIVRSYGMTETASQIVATQIGASRSDLSTSGRALAGNSISFEDTTQRILISSHSKMLGYWSDGQLDSNQNSNGQLLTNDYGHFENGNLVVDGRLDRIFKCGGENIQPELIERVLLAHPEVLSAQVMAEPDLEFGHVPVAYVKTAKNELNKILLDSINSHIQQNLKGFFRPHRLLDISQFKGAPGLKSQL